MEAPYLDLNLGFLSKHGDSAHLDKQVLLLDNIRDGHSSADVERFFEKHPFKISFTFVLFCLSGNLRFRLTLQDFELHSGDVLVGQSGIIGQYCGMGRNAKVALIAFIPESFPVTNQSGLAMLLQQRKLIAPMAHLPENVMTECMTVYDLMKAKIRETENPFLRDSLLGYMQVVTYDVVNALLASNKEREAAPKERFGRSQELYNRFMEEVQRHYTQERSITYYADKLCVTPKYLSQVVHRVSGRFAGDWISDFVILEARALLKSRKYTIQQIADMLNFANQSFFGKYFKEKTGLSPSEYKNK
ncbi:MAG: helix-turn-helix domain-containing protein [Bacteroides sp.]|nr:helix-turn-helix domain-containing protein [Ruminococcus flavefaciens]MCM1554708.1 helix-turn-helix domain-containing protein [Bacteroides sp.]